MAYGATQLNVSTQEVITRVITNQSEQYSYEQFERSSQRYERPLL